MNAVTVALIEKLGQKLGATSEYVWEVLLRQAMISAVTNTIIFVTISICFCKFMVGMINLIRSVDDELVEALLWLLVAVIAMLFMLVFGVMVKNIITAAVNPEYWALQQLLSR